jgi:hypothetical protein
MLQTRVYIHMKLRLLLATLLITIGVAACSRSEPEPVVVTRVATPTLASTATALPVEQNEPVELLGTSIHTETVVITFTVRGQKEYLFDMPTLADVPATRDSVEQAHFDLLDRVTGGEGTATLTFPKPDQAPPWPLIFNPEHTETNYVAPQVRMEVSDD